VLTVAKLEKNEIQDRQAYATARIEMSTVRLTLRHDREMKDKTNIAASNCSKHNFITSHTQDAHKYTQYTVPQICSFHFNNSNKSESLFL